MGVILNCKDKYRQKTSKKSLENVKKYIEITHIERV